LLGDDDTKEEFLLKLAAASALCCLASAAMDVELLCCEFSDELIRVVSSSLCN
jgi:hypothetical protein